MRLPFLSWKNTLGKLGYRLQGRKSKAIPPTRTRRSHVESLEPRVVLTIEPEIEVLDGLLQSIPDGVGTVDVGETDLGVPISYTFTIENQGPADLTIDTNSLVVPSGFTVTQAPAAVVSPLEQTTFSIELDATADGTFSGELSFGNNDSDEDVFNFTISATVRPPVPEIDVTDESSSSIADDTGAISLGSTQFGTPLGCWLTIQNQGNADLTIDLNSFVVPSGFTITQWPDETVPSGGGQTYLTLELDGTTAGTFSGEVSFATNDVDENPFNFQISGTVLPPAPEIAVVDDTWEEVADNWGFSGFGTTEAGTPDSQTFTIENSGDADLEIDLDSFSVPAGFSITQWPQTTVAANGGQTSFTVQLDGTEGGFAGQLSFGTNDSSEATFNFQVAGYAAAPQSDPAVQVVAPLGSRTGSEDSEVTIIDLRPVFASSIDEPLVYLVVQDGNPDVIQSTVKEWALRLQYQPNASGKTTIWIMAIGTQSGSFAIDKLNVTVNPVNDFPATTGIDPFTLNEDSEAAIALDPFFADIDLPEDQHLVYSAGIFNTGELYNPIQSLSIADGVLTIHSAQDNFGYAEVAVRAADGQGGFVSTTLWVIVNPVNDAPQSYDIPTQSHSSVWVFDHTGYVLTSKALLDLWPYFNDIEDSHFLSFEVSASGNALGGEPTVSDDGFLHYTYKTDRGFQGSSTLTVTATDRDGASASEQFTVNVNNSTDTAPPYTPSPEQATVSDGAGGYFTVPLPPPRIDINMSVGYPTIPDDMEDDLGAFVAVNNDFSEGGFTTKTVTVGPGLTATVLARAKDNQPDRDLQHRAGFGGWWGYYGWGDSQLKQATVSVVKIEIPDDWEYKDDLISSSGYRSFQGTVTFDAPEGVKLWVPASYLYDVDYYYSYYYLGWSGRLVELPAQQGVRLDSWGSIFVVIEGLEEDQGDLTATYVPGRSYSSSSVLADSAALALLQLDVQIDSDNDNGFNPPDGSAEEDAIEHDSRLPGKRIPVNADNRDFDGIPDYFDGFNLDGHDSETNQSPDNAADDALTLPEGAEDEEGFVPLLIKLPAGINPEHAELIFSYVASDPNQAQVLPQGWRSLPAGGIRIWTVNESQPRNPHKANALQDPGQYIAPTGYYGGYSEDFWGYYGGWGPYGYGYNYGFGGYYGYGWWGTPGYADSYRVSSLGDVSEDGTITLYVEGISAGRYSIYVGLDPDGTPKPLRDSQGDLQYDSNGQIVYEWKDLFYGFSITDTVDVTVFNTVTISATDKYARETNGGELSDNASFTISRGEGNVFGDQQVYYRLISSPESGGATDPLISPPNADYSANGYGYWGSWWWGGWNWYGGSLVADPYTRVGMASIPHGQSSVTVSIEPINDDRVEWDEKVTVELISYDEYRLYHDQPGTSGSMATPNDGIPEQAWYGWGTFGGYWWNPWWYGYSYGGNFYDISGSPTAEMTILDNDFIQADTSRNVDTGSTGLVANTQVNNMVAVGLYDGGLSLVLPLGDNLPAYRTGDNLQPMGVIELRLPWNENQRPTQLKSKLTFGSAAGDEIEFDVSGLEDFLTVNPARSLRLTVLGPDNLADLLPSGNYDFTLSVAALTDDWHARTFHGQTEIVNRLGTAGTTEFGQSWWLEGLDRLVPGDGINFPGAISSIESNGEVQYAASNLGAQGAAVASGQALVRGDNTSAWYATTIAGQPKILPIDPDENEEDGSVELDRSAWPPTDYIYGGFGWWWWWYTPARADERYTPAGLAEQEQTATWTFGNLDVDRQYQVFVTWDPADDRASNAPYTVTGAKAVASDEEEKSILVNQQFTPGEFYYAGKWWRSLGYYVVIEDPEIGPSLSVTLSTKLPDQLATEGAQFVDGIVVAGSVMLVGQWNFATPTGSFNQLLGDDPQQVAAAGYWIESGYDPDPGTFTLATKWGSRYEFRAHGLLQATEDRNGNRRELHYSDQAGDSFPGELSSIQSQGGLNTTYTYAGGYLASVTDFAARVTTLANSGGLVTDVYQPNPDSAGPGPQTHFGYSSGGLLASVTDANAHATIIAYAPASPHMAQRITNADGFSWVVHSVLADGINVIQRPATGDVGRTSTAAGVAGVPEPRASFADPNSVGTAQEGTYQWYFQTDAHGLVTALLNPIVPDPWLWKRRTDGLVTKATLPKGGGGFRGLGEDPLDKIEFAFGYDSRGNQNSLAYVGGPSESWTHSPSFSVPTSHTDRGGRTTGYVLDGRGNTWKIIEPLRQTWFEYTPAPMAIGAMPGGLVEFAYAAVGTADQVTTQTTYYPGGDLRVGLVQTVVNPDIGLPTTYNYDVNRNLSKTTFGTRVTDYVYDRLNRLRQVTEADPLTGQHGRPVTVYQYDAVGNMRFEIDPRGNVTEHQYDEMNRVHEVIQPPAGGSGSSDPYAAITGYTYDANGNVRFESDPYGHVTEHRYDQLNRETMTLLPAPGMPLEHPDLELDVLQVPTIIRVYDVLGNLAAVSDPRASASSAASGVIYTTFSYDALNRLIQTDQPPTEDHLGPQTKNEYDAVDNLRFVHVRTVDDQQEPIFLTTEYNYDLLDRLIAVIPPPNADGELTPTSYVYDLRDNRTQVLDAYGNPEITQYDKLNRPIYAYSRNPGDGLGRLVTHTHYLPTGDVDYVETYNELAPAVKQLTGFASDNLGRVITEIQPDPDGAGPRTSEMFRYEYDLAGHRVRDTHFASPAAAGGLVTDYFFDNLGRNWKVTGPPVTQGDLANNLTHVERLSLILSYDRAGRVIQRHEFSDYTGTLVNSIANFQYDALGRLWKTTGPTDNSNQRPVTYTYYDAAGNVRFTVDPRGFLTEQEYDALGRLKRTIQPATAQHGHPLTENIYDALGNVLVTTDTLNRSTVNQYDKQGRVISTKLAAVDGGIPEVTYHYDLLGNLDRSTDPEGNVTRQQFDGLSRLTKAIHPRGNGQAGEVESETRRDGLGRIEWTEDEQDRRTQFAYDLTNQTTQIVPPPLDGGAALVVTLGEQDASLAGGVATWTLSLDPAKHYAVYVTWTASPENATNVVYRLKDNSQLVGHEFTINQQEQPQGFSADGVTWQRLFSIAPFSGVLKVEVEGSGAGLFDVGGLHVVEVAPGGQPIENTYTAFGRLWKQTDTQGKTTEYVRDELGRATGVIDPRNVATWMSYDVQGNQTGVLDADGNLTRFGYDAFGRVVLEQAAAGTRSYAYDLAGNEYLSVDRSGRAVRVDYDALNRPVQERWYATLEGALNQVNSLTTLDYTFDAGGRLKVADDGQFRYAYDYDTIDRLTGETRTGPGGTVYLQRGYPNRRDGLRQFLDVYLGGEPDTTTAFTYDGNGRVATITQTAMSTAAVQDKHVSFAYNADGQFGTISRYEAQTADTSKFVASSVYAYDGRGQLVTLDHYHGAAFLAGYTWTYDAQGRITNATSKDGTAEYAYDEAGQLEAADYNVPQASGLANETFDWDANGNPDLATGPGNANRPSFDGTYEYQYDAEGNRTRRTNMAGGGGYDIYTWDHRNRLTSVSHYDADDELIGTVEYAYDYLNRLVLRSGPAADGISPTDVDSYVYDGDQIILRLSPTGDVKDRYLWGPAVDQLLADEQIRPAESGPPTVNTLWALGDHQNSVRDLVDFNETSGQATVVDHVIYEAFGQPANEGSPTAATLFGFTGRLFDRATSLQYNSARWLDPNLPQWLSEDPILFAAGDPNPRRYAGNDPVNRDDPTGLFTSYISGWLAGFAKDTCVEEPVAWAASFHKSLDGGRFLADTVINRVTRAGAIFSRSYERSQKGEDIAVAFGNESASYLWENAESLTSGVPMLGHAITWAKHLEGAYEGTQHGLTPTQSVFATAWERFPIINLTHRFAESATGKRIGGADHGQRMEAGEIRDNWTTGFRDTVMLLFGLRGLVALRPGAPVAAAQPEAVAGRTPLNPALTLENSAIFGKNARIPFPPNAAANPAGVGKLLAEAKQSLAAEGTPLKIGPDGTPELPAFDQQTTRGILVTNEGRVISLQSGGPSPIYANYPAATHVEGKAAIFIRENSSSGGVVYHNNPSGTCGFCHAQVPTLLPEGATLKVVPPPGTVPPPRWHVNPNPYVGNTSIPKTTGSGH